MSTISQKSSSQETTSKKANFGNLNNFFEISPFFGFYSLQCKKFFDKDIFDSKYQNHIRLIKVKIWYGTTAPTNTQNENINGKYILGIQCEYHNSINGEQKKTDLHCGSLNSNDIIIKELDLSHQDYITKFYICYNDIISYIKFITKKGQILEAGQFNKDLEKTISFNLDPYPHMIQFFHGYYNEYGLRALGCTHLQRKNYFFFKLFDVFRFRYFLKKNENEKEKWTEDKIKELNYECKTFIKLCLLPNAQFYCVIKYLF